MYTDLALRLVLMRSKFEGDNEVKGSATFTVPMLFER